MALTPAVPLSTLMAITAAEKGSYRAEEGASREDGNDLRGLTGCDVGKVVFRVDVARGEMFSPILHA